MQIYSLINASIVIDYCRRLIGYENNRNLQLYCRVYALRQSEGKDRQNTCRNSVVASSALQLPPRLKPEISGECQGIQTTAFILTEGGRSPPVDHVTRTCSQSAGGRPVYAAHTSSPIRQIYGRPTGERHRHRVRKLCRLVWPGFSCHGDAET